MSRSYKRSPYCGQRNRKHAKTIANRRIRRVCKQNYEAIAHHSSYKKYNDSYDICDFYWLCSWPEYWRNEVNSYNQLCMAYPDRDWPAPNKKECYRRWVKSYKRK